MLKHIILSGLPGKMATEVAEAILKSKDIELMPWALTGENMPEYCDIKDRRIHLIKPADRNTCDFSKNSKEVFFVDYTHPSVANSNCDFYCGNNLNFVMGTTGGDKKLLEERVKNSNSVAVIAPNMAKQIVAFQSMMKYAAETFPNAFKDYTLEIVESHQQGKADTSGTAKAMVEYFNKLGIPFTNEQIKMIRNPEEQLAMGIPESALAGHGHHTYKLKSQDGNTLFQFTHNVNGRGIYADGTLEAIRFLHKKVESGEKGKVYSMFDVLQDK